MCNVIVICPLEPHRRAHGHDKNFWNFADARNQKSLGGFTLSQVHWNCHVDGQCHGLLPYGVIGIPRVFSFLLCLSSHMSTRSSFKSQISNILVFEATLIHCWPAGLVPLKVCQPVNSSHPGQNDRVFNTLRPRQNGRHFPDDFFKCIFLNENVWIAINISIKFVPKGPINNIPTLVQIMAWRRPGDKPLSEPMMVRLLTHISVTRPPVSNLGFGFAGWNPPSIWKLGGIFQMEGFFFSSQIKYHWQK